VTKYHVEFDVEGLKDSEWEPSGALDRAKILYTGVLGEYGYTVRVPADAVITETAPAAVAGWYRRDDVDQTDVFHWTAEEIEEYPADQFYRNYTRMKAPEPWVEEPEAKYKDGYYRMDDGYLYRRQAGRWELFLARLGGWDGSSHDDNDIESDYSVTYLGVDAP
jgi:hypothetical protein